MAKNAAKSNKPAAAATPKKAAKKTGKKPPKQIKIFDPLGPGHKVSSKSGG